MTITDHPQRFQLANELHARPFPTLDVPCTAVYLAIKTPEHAVARDRAEDLAHLIALLDRHGVAHPQPGATHYSGQIGRHMLKWESHTEFVTYSCFTNHISDRPYDPAEFEVFPKDWLATAPGVRVASCHIRVQPRPDASALRAELNEHFVAESLAVSEVLDNDAVIAGDFRIDPAGHTRFAIYADPSTRERRIGRIVQRLCEIETYKSMSMLGFARSKQLAAPLTDLDRRLTDLMDRMGDDDTAAEDTLSELLSTSATLEQMVTHNAFRFGATGAYEAIVMQRIAALRERRFEGRQSFGDFMMRRYDPAMRTVKSAEARLSSLADRAIRAGELLRTRVDVERSAQNQQLLQSMDRRVDMQLKLQKTVEGLSVVAISYYAVSLAAYGLSPLAKVLGLAKPELTALITVPIVLVVWAMIRRIQKHMHD